MYGSDLPKSFVKEVQKSRPPFCLAGDFVIDNLPQIDSSEMMDLYVFQTVGGGRKQHFPLLLHFFVHSILFSACQFFVIFAK